MKTFWEHLDELRGCLVKVIIAVVVGAVAAFVFKDLLFGVALAPCETDFLMYRLTGAEPFAVNLINTSLTEQLMVHVKAAACVGMMVASPYVLYILFRYVSPALYANERRYAGRIVVSAYVMFIVGTVVNYLVIFPFMLRFLVTYQVATAVTPMLSISSYMDTLMGMGLLMALVFELPVVCWLLAKMGLLQAKMMKACRRHAIVAVLIASAVITPTTDMFTLFVVAVPIWLLYELSILIVRWSATKPIMDT